ncbi:MAG: SpoIID/LytB domain-containing protein [Candidatus Hydrogenedentota bacterium]|nr:MAG: SpoIID/LytB domain-containing protein [Candidatus Hydrogenedentota bacterium]
MAEQTIEKVVSIETLYSLPSSGLSDMGLVPPPNSHLSKSKEKQADVKAESESEENEEEMSIPVVEPKKIEPRKVYIEPTVRVQILGNAPSITIVGKEGLTMSFGNNFLTVEPGSRIRFKSRSARVSVRSYAVGIGTFTADEHEDAMKLAEKWKRERYTVRLIKAGGPLVQADGTAADTTVYWVALGIFKEERAAERFRDRMFDRGISCWVIDESLLGPRGNIEMVDAKGTPRAYADSRVIIASDSPIRIFDVPFGHGFWESGNSEDRIYRGPVEVVADQSGKLGAISELKLEEYVKGVVPVEIRLTAHDEALKAQAISARTEAVAKLGIHHIFDPYDFCASQHCQEFGGLTRRTARTDAAVDATRGQVLMCGGSPVDAVYSANCGGHTESNEHVWSSRPNAALRGVSDLYGNPESLFFPLPASQLGKWLRNSQRAYCSDPRVGNRNGFRWKVTRTAKQMDRIVNRYRRVGSVKDIRVLRRGISGRAVRVKIVGTHDTAVVNKELQIRRVLGKLKSSMFIVDIKHDSSGNPTSFTFYGGGWGHGVGMCQSGAEGMALRDFDYAAILKHYFSNVEIKQLYE